MNDDHPQPLQKKIGYALSAIEYIGLYSWSRISRLGDSASKLGSSMSKSAAKPFSKTRRKKAKRQRREPPVSVESIQKGKIQQLESTISQLERRLAVLEKHGVKLPENSQARPAQEKVISDQKRAFLRMLVDDNKQLRNMTK